MDRTQPPSDSATYTPTRRRLLAAAGSGALAATAGCVREARSLVTRDDPSQVSLDIKTAPADADPRSIRIARYLSGKLDAVGIDATITPMSHESLFRDVLLNQAFDLYVAPFPGRTDPDFLYTLLHSRFATEPGWQNPVGYADLEVDRLLDRQRRQAGAARREPLATVQRAVARDQPFSVVAFPDEIRAVRDDAFTGWDRASVHTPQGYLALTYAGDAPDATDADAPAERSLTTTLTDPRPTENLNPLAVEFRSGGTVTELLYDPIGRWVDGAVEPWLAADWTWSELATESGSAVTVRLREDLTWHDGTAITADDVAFTFEFLADTSLGRLDSPVPAPRFRGRGSLVTDADVLDDRTVRLAAAGSSRATAARSLTVPVLPRHVWESKATQATVAGLDLNGGVTRALVWSNPDPVGSGPFRVEQRSPKETLVLTASEDHFLTRDGLDDHLTPYAGAPAVDRLRFTVVPSGGAAVELVDAGEADATASGVMPTDVPTIGRSDAIDLVVDQPRSFYHVGYNLRRAPTSSPRFRRAVARLLDKAYLTNTVFDGFGSPAASPLARHESLAPKLAWQGEDPELPFPGERGSLDVDRAREAFREAGYRYSESGNLLVS